MRKKTNNPARILGLMLMALMVLSPTLVHGTGLDWPTNQLLPSFSTPAPVLDAIDISSSSGAEVDMFASLEGIVNRTQPQIVVDNNEWLDLHHLSYTVLASGYSAIVKYRSYVTGLVVTDPNQPDTLNLATTIAGVKNELICNPSLLPTLTNAPYNLPIVDDLRGRFSNKYQVYGYLYTNYWPQCTHRLIAGMETNVDGVLRDYLVAMKVATVWLDPGTSQDASLLGSFVSTMTPLNGVYIGWWPNEFNGLDWIGTYGIPVMASDYYSNGSVFSGCRNPIDVPNIPPPPPLQNKIYVALIMSDGDNVQYMQGAMNIFWADSARGNVPISWTVSPLTTDLDPGMLNYYWNTAYANECLISGPDGAGYAHIEQPNWSSANRAGLARLSNGYLQHSGLRVITVWDSVNSGIAQAYATNCPTLLGLTDQGGSYSAVDLGLRTIKLAPTYAGTISQLTSAISNAAAGWNGSAPLFIAAQVDTWNLHPSDLLNAANSFNANYQFVRADQLFMLANGILAPPSINVATDNQVGSANTYPFTPTWNVATNGDLILGQSPTFTSGNFNLDNTNCNVNSLTSGGSLTIGQTTVNNPAGPDTMGMTTISNYVTCGNRTNTPAAGSNIVYTLTGVANGYNLTNITVYGGWQDNGRDQQAYTVYYSTVSAPTNFIELTGVSYNPAGGAGNTPSATRVTITSATANGVLAANVAALKFDFTTPPSENGWCGYAQIAVFGTPSPHIITANQFGSANTYPFTPNWSVVTNGDLILGQTPTSSVGDFSLEWSGRDPNSLTAGGSLTIGTTPNGSTSVNYVTCGNSRGNSSLPGRNVIYPLTGAANGYTLTNITVYGGWVNNGRDQQAYNVYYSTVSAPTIFIPLTSVNYGPSVPGNTPSATRVMIVPSTANGILAANVAAVKFDFGSPPSENGYCGYAQIAVYGTISPAVTTNTLPATAADVVGSRVTFMAGFSGANLAYQWQKISGGMANNITGATNLTLTLTNLQLTDTASYQLMASNTYGVAVSSPGALTVSSVLSPVNNVITAYAGQTGLGASVGAFTPTWAVASGSLIQGMSPSSTIGSFSQEWPGRDPNTLTAGGSLTIGTTPNGSTSVNYVTCGIGGGSNIVYTLSSSASGYNLTNITVYGGWVNNGRDQQAYTVYYSKVTAPTTFIQLDTVNYLPSVSSGVQSATRATLMPSSGFLATNVAAVKFDFTTPAGTNGYEGYSEIQVFGVPTVIPPATNSTNIAFQIVGNNLTLAWPSDHTGWRLQVQTNSMTQGLGTNWVDVANSTTTNQMTIPINPTNGSVFYRLIYP